MSALLKKLLQVAAPVSALALISSSAMAGISATKHNLGSSGTGPNTVSDTAEICVFCHTPHGAAQSDDNPPLWNKVLPTSSYTTYSSTTMDAGGTGATNQVAIGSVSLACLSCHDGTQAMDNILNAPGSGQYSATGGTGGTRGYVWTGPEVDGKITNHDGFIAALGTDLTNDHPIGIAYCGWKTGAAAATALADTQITPSECADPDFKTATKVTVGANNMWFVDRNTTNDGVKQKTDMILYTRSFNGTSGPSVECASCHDPHTETVTFLRTPNTNSNVCLSCHDK